MIKNNFLTGLAILLPFALTCWILLIIIRLLTNPFLAATEGLLSRFVTFDPDLLAALSRLMILISLALLTFILGFLGSLFFARWMFKGINYVMHQIPLISKIYKGAQDMIHTLFAEESTSFRQVVLAPFPHSKAYAIGLVSNETPPAGTSPELSKKVSLFVAGTPNPTVGLMILYERDQLIYLDMTTEQAIKFIVSCGVIKAPIELKNEGSG